MRAGALWMADGSETWDGWRKKGVRFWTSAAVSRKGSFEPPHLGVATAALELGSQAAAGWLIGVGGGAIA